jgi:N-acetyl-anhydromuramyl-L-alanine amidase AmpD
MRRHLSPLVLAGAAALLAGCDDLAVLLPENPIGYCASPAQSLDLAPQMEPLDSAFAAAGREFGVPVELLKAIGWVETRWQMVDGHAEFPGQPQAHGLMALKGEQLERGAALAGISADEARSQPAANIRAAAALLRQHAVELGISAAEPGGWAPAVARYSGIALAAGRAAYVHEDVYATLRRGVRRDEAPSANAALSPTDVTPRYEFPVAAATSGATTDYGPARWRGSPNFNARPAGGIGRIAVVIVHTCEGSYTGCWSWLANPDSRVSAHYVVREDGSEITQLVREADRAWHIGSSYDCTLNQGWDCWRNGQSNNHFSIGIEHAGYASQRFWSAAQIDASARLVCDVTRRHGIRRDDIRIVGHAQLQPHNRSDPGASWPWAQFHARIDAHCGGTNAGGLVVDGDNDGNDTSNGYIEVSRNWTATRQTPGYYGSGYQFAATGTAADPAIFHFHMPSAGTRSIDAWWTQGANRSPRARWTAVDPAGRHVGTAHADQQRNGGRWNTVGTWHFPAGWNSIQLSREGPQGCVVIADAVRVRGAE